MIRDKHNNLDVSTVSVNQIGFQNYSNIRISEGPLPTQSGPWDFFPSAKFTPELRLCFRQEGDIENTLD